MGSSGSRESPPAPRPEDIAQFRKLTTGLPDNFSIPEVPEKRRLTDKKFIVIFALTLLLLVPFLVYTLINSDLDRILIGYDKCGNVCGKKNPVAGDIPCSGKDMTDKPFLLLRNVSLRSSFGDAELTFGGESYRSSGGFSTLVNDECVHECPQDSNKIFHICIPGQGSVDADAEWIKLGNEITADLQRSAGYIVLLCLIGLGITSVMFLLFRYFTAAVVWVILIGSVVVIILFTIALWVAGANNDGYIPVAITFTIVSLIVVIMLICLFKRIKLVIRLFKESIKVIFGIPLILLEPLLTFVAVCAAVAIFLYVAVWLASSGYLTAVTSVTGDRYEYEPNDVMIFTIFFNVIVFLWIYEFIIGCQHMVIAGAVSAYYFARDKKALRSPIYNSFYNVVKYHLGTIAFGSLIVTAISILRRLLRTLANNKTVKLIVDCICGLIEDFLRYLSKNAYILTAMHGQPFYKSGKRAVKLLAANALSAVAINSVGDFVLTMAELLITITTAIIGALIMNTTGITHIWIAVLLGCLFTALIAHCFFTVFETAVDTIFLCYCEDSCMNDGTSRPYYMTTDLMTYMEDAKATIK